MKKNKNIMANPFLFALLPCGLRNAFKDSFYRKFPLYNNEDEESSEVLIEGNLNYEKDFYSKIDSLVDTSELPDIFITSDINSLHHQPFLQKFLNTDNFDIINIDNG